MPVIGIESSAHTLGVGIVSRGKVLANSKRMYRITDKGIIPARVADFHSEGVAKTIGDALSKARVEASEIEAVGYTKGPGIGTCLGVGHLAAKVLAGRLNVPLIPVNHGLAHIEIARHLHSMTDPLALYVSGGNSQILGLVERPHRHYHVYGETFDIGIGNMLDVFARAAGMNPAWGSSVAKSAAGGRYLKMPYTVKGMDFAFGGLLTHAIRRLGSDSVHDISFSLQETAFSMLCEATERALLLTGKRELVLCGGVAQSARLVEMIREMAEPHSVSIGIAPDEYNADNGAMIAMVAERMLRAGMVPAAKECTIRQRYRIDQARVGW
jgi:glycoprotease/Kae1 family metallohydrolase